MKVLGSDSAIYLQLGGIRIGLMSPSSDQDHTLLLLHWLNGLTFAGARPRNPRLQLFIGTALAHRSLYVGYFTRETGESILGFLKPVLPNCNRISTGLTKL